VGCEGDDDRKDASVDAPMADTTPDATAADATAPDAELAADAGPLQEPGTVPIFPEGYYMGCFNEKPECGVDEYPGHFVTINHVLTIDYLEVSQLRYQDCMLAGVCSAPEANFTPATTPGHPVRDVTWQQAADFCAWRGMRLPSEAEREFQAGGNGGRPYPAAHPWSRGPGLPCVGCLHLEGMRPLCWGKRCRAARRARRRGHPKKWGCLPGR